MKGSTQRGGVTRRAPFLRG
uniref:Uncharacterized protein n=1 Tax=Anguilla anguilla TaxID=7936 RepID=A0A0E9PLK5_ANGAN